MALLAGGFPPLPFISECNICSKGTYPFLQLLPPAVNNILVFIWLPASETYWWVEPTRVLRMDDFMAEVPSSLTSSTVLLNVFSRLFNRGSPLPVAYCCWEPLKALASIITGFPFGFGFTGWKLFVDLLSILSIRCSGARFVLINSGCVREGDCIILFLILAYYLSELS